MTTVTNALATRDNTPGGLVRTHADSFASVLPTHIKSEQWVRLAQGALKKGKRLDDGRYELEAAAQNNIGVFLAHLLDAARLGLEPGTEQYYLTVRKVKGRPEILGIVGYQGYIELMYRAGAISSVVAELVYTGDKFTYRPGRDERPDHEIDWDAEDRGQLRLVYAYAVMKDGATSKVVVLNKANIARIKAKSQGASSDYSPWQTAPESMWLKSAVRQLQKWVPTSAEYMREQMRAKAAAETAPIAEHIAPLTPEYEGAREHVDPETGEIVVEGELVDDGAPVPPAAYDPGLEPEGWK